jgi:AcrR family transcriptional regulator
MAIADGRPGKLTPRGLATRERILEAAADLIYAHGVHATNNELVRKAAGASGSQLSHYFPDKESLVRAVIAWRADSMMGLRESPPRGPLDSFAALRAWAGSYIENAMVLEGGCSFGSLASEIMKTDLDVHDQIAAGFDRWREAFRSGLHAMRDRHDLRRTANLRGDDGDVATGGRRGGEPGRDQHGLAPSPAVFGRARHAAEAEPATLLSGEFSSAKLATPPAMGTTKPAVPAVRRRAASLPSAMSCVSTRSTRSARTVSQKSRSAFMRRP